MTLQRPLRFLAALAPLVLAFSSPAWAGTRCAGKALLHVQTVESVPLCDVTLCVAYHLIRDFALGADGCASVLTRKKVIAGSFIAAEPGNFIEAATHQFSPAALKPVRDGLIAIQAGIRESCRLPFDGVSYTFTWYGRNLRQNTFAMTDTGSAPICDAAMMSLLQAVGALEIAILNP